MPAAVLVERSSAKVWISPPALAPELVAEALATVLGPPMKGSFPGRALWCRQPRAILGKPPPVRPPRWPSCLPTLYFPFPEASPVSRCNVTCIMIVSNLYYLHDDSN